MSYKDHFTVIWRDDLWTLQECLVTEIESGGKSCFFTYLSRYLSQTHDQLEDFYKLLDVLLSSFNGLNPYYCVVVGDFNVTSSNWWNIDKDSLEGLEIDSAGYNQIIDQSTHITKVSSSCINLIFSTDPNLIKESGVEMSLFNKYHHNVIFVKLCFKIPLPPPYFRKERDYKNANVENIQQNIARIVWNFLFHDTTVDTKVQILNESFKNILHNFISNKIIKSDYKEPPWRSKIIKSKLK